MKKLLLIAPLFFALAATAQVKDTAKKEIPLPQNGIQTPLYYLVMPANNWDKIIQMLRRSNAPSADVDDVVTYFQKNLVELKPPVSETSKPKK